MKKAQGLSLNVIILAVLGLLVLLVLILIFTGKMGFLSKEISGCESKQGAKCVDDAGDHQCPSDPDGDAGYFTKYSYDCKEGKVCCYSQCKALGGKCSPSCDAPLKDLGSANCQGNQVCCR